MRYFDTSFLMPVFIQEAFSARVEKVLKRRPVGEAAVSDWTRVEFSSALARQVRMGDLDRATTADIESDFDAMVNDTFVILSLTADDFDVARSFLRRYETGLRAGDALHLAIASNRSAETIYSLDRGLMRAGRLLGLPVDSGGRLP